MSSDGEEFNATLSTIDPVKLVSMLVNRSNPPTEMAELASRARLRALYSDYWAELCECSWDIVPEYAVLCKRYWDSAPNYFDRRRTYLALKDEYLDRRRDYLKKKENYLLRRGEDILARDLERELLTEERHFIRRYEDRFLVIKKDFLARKQEYFRSFEDYDAKARDFNAMRDYFLASKRDESTPSTASFASLWPKYFSHDVFLSFRGKDVRKAVVDRLYKDLSKAGLRVFLDSENLKKGEIIWPSLERAMKKSAICIPIFSEGYADSTWCLKEAAAMLKSPHLIIPLFYGVDPTHVRYPPNKKSPYKKSFEKHYGRLDRHLKEEIDGWKLGLGDICSRSGWTMDMVADDFNVGVDGIVKDVIDILHSH